MLRLLNESEREIRNWLELEKRKFIDIIEPIFIIWSRLKDRARYRVVIF